MISSSPAARWRALALLAAIFGTGVSVYLLVEYTTGQAGVCLTGSGCDEVRASEFAYPLGIPMPIFGVVFYAVAAWLTARTLGGAAIAGIAPRTALAIAAVVGVAFSAVLTGLEAFVIGAFCTWCLASAVASVVLLGAAGGLVMSADAPEETGGSSRARHQRERTRERQRSGLRRLATLGTTATALLFGGLLVAGALASSPGASDAGDLAPATSPHLGQGRVTVVEFADFQCPGCAVVGPMLAGMAASDEMTLVFRYFPLETIHANANASARAAEAAKLQGGFWTMSDLLYGQQAAWENLSAADADRYFAGLAEQAGLDVALWTSDYTSQAVRDAVSRDAQAARDLNLPGTPTIYIGGELYSGERSVAAFRNAIAAAAASMTPAPAISPGS